MSTQQIFELIGYIGSAFVLASFLMASVVKLRIINSIGCIVSVIYGLLIHAYPTILMNGVLLLINLYFLYKMSKENAASYHVYHAKEDDAFLGYFLEQHAEDIRKFFPSFESAKGCNYIVVSHCADEAAGVLLGNLDKDGKLDVQVDYTTPQYRDLSVGKWLAAHAGEAGVKRAVLHVPTKHHAEYMKKIGFVKAGDAYELKL